VAALDFDKGLIPAVAQDRLTGQVRMVAWMNAEALRRTVETGHATFFSRSRNAIWQKGETSGHHLVVSAVYADCDEDTLLLLVDPAGPSCHTGRPTCFFRQVDETGAVRDVARDASTFLWELESEIEERATASATKSYTRSLLDGGAPKIGEKIREEAGELAVALEKETDDRVANEAADLLYHVLVGLRLRAVPLRKVIEVLAKRSGTSGLVEKASRTKRAE
jgi:phosphoribosyl-AMP cyclohydrolase / phosphoribosyl-ATP pyrophosphohydrolase